MPDRFATQFATIAVAHLLAVISPGPDFAIVVKQSIERGRHAAVWTSVGIGSGILLHISYSLLGLALFLSRSALLFTMIRFAGGGYLLFLGLGSLRAARGPAAVGTLAAIPPSSALHAWRLGLMTNALNPKATLFFLAIFTAVVTPTTPLAWQLAYGLWMIGATMAWFSLVAYGFTQAKVRERFLRFGHWFQRATGLVLIALGLRLLLS